MSDSWIVKPQRLEQKATYLDMVHVHVYIELPGSVKRLHSIQGTALLLKRVMVKVWFLRTWPGWRMFLFLHSSSSQLQPHCVAWGIS